MRPLVRIKFTPGGRSKFLLFPQKTKRALLVSGRKAQEILADDFLKLLRKHLKTDGLGLILLNHRTIADKKAKGQALPTVPMYGEGVSSARSYYSLLEVRRGSRGVSVGFGRNKKHHSGLKIKDLAIIHAKGNVILPKRNPIVEGLRVYDVRRRVPALAGKLLLRTLKGIF